MRRLLIALGGLLLASSPAFADSLVHNLATNATSPLPAGSCFYVDQGPGTDAKLCSGWAAAIGALTGSNNLSDLGNAATARANLGLGTLATLASPLPVANGGTGATASSGTALDNITGFSSAGLLDRTGAGAYSFLALPLTGASGGTGVNNGSFTLTLGGSTSLPAAPSSTQCLHESSSGAITTTGSDCGAGGGGGALTSIAVGVGLTTTPGTQNTGTQAITTSGTISPQMWASAYTANHTVALADGVLTYVANGTSGVTFTLPQSTSTGDGRNGNFNPCFVDESGHGFTLATTASTFYGGPGISGSSVTFPANSVVCASPDGANWGLSVNWGTQPVAGGGTGLTATPSNGQIPIGNGSGYTLATLAAGPGVSITNGAGSITVAATGGGGGGSTVVKGALSGMITSYNSAASIAITAGQATDDGDTAMWSTTQTFYKSVSGAWAAGAGTSAAPANGMGNGLTVAANTWYHVCAIDSGGAPDFFFDTSATCSHPPSGAGTMTRRIGSFLTNASSQVVQYVQDEDTFYWNAPVQDLNNVSPGTASRTLYVLTVPTGVKVRPVLAIQASQNLWITSPDQPDLAPGSMNAGGGYNFYGNGGAVEIPRFVYTNTAGQVAIRPYTTSANIYEYTIGWQDSRGRY